MTIVDGKEVAIAPYDEKLDVTVCAYAVQEKGFATVQEAYEAYNDQWDDAIKVGTLAELKAAVAVGGDVKLTQDIIIPKEGDAITVPETVTVVLDLNGKMISAGERMTLIKNYGTLSIKNGTINGYGQSYAILNKNEMTVDSVVIIPGNSSYPYAISNSGEPNVEPDKYANLTIQGDCKLNNGQVNNWYGYITVGNATVDENASYNVANDSNGNLTITKK